MTAVDGVKEKAKDLGSAGGEKGSLARRVLVPLAASAASAATAYAVRKAPALIQDKLLPKLKENDGARETLTKAKDKVEEAVSNVKERVSGAQTEAQRRAPGGRSTTTPSLSPAQREKKQRERAARRRKRREALSR
jgi:hypothetical protein